MELKLYSKTNMTLSRRRFLANTSAVVAAASIPQELRANAGNRHLEKPQPNSISLPKSELKELALVAVDAAMSAGASYADTRITIDRELRYMDTTPILDREMHGFGVRVLVNGYWGFTASTVWTKDEAYSLAKKAVEQAVASSVGKTRQLSLGPSPDTVKGSWTAPIKYDPFEVSHAEKIDYVSAASAMVSDYLAKAAGSSVMHFKRQFKIVATSEGSVFDTTNYLSDCQFGVLYPDQYSRNLGKGGYKADFFSPSNQGWEYISESGLIDKIPYLIDQAEQTRHITPVEIGRFDAVVSASAMAQLVNGTLGPALELDRAMGFEANEDGATYLHKPLQMVGKEEVSSNLLSLVADNTLSHGLATTPYDDEGVKSEPFELVRNGVLVDFQTTREQADWLAPYYDNVGREVRSNGCARGETAMSITGQLSSNLVVKPADNEDTFEDLVASVDHGIAILAAEPRMDQQQLNGILSNPSIREIQNGKLGRYIQGAGVQFRSPELWQSLTALGGKLSQKMTGLAASKSQPMQRSYHSIQAVPGVFSNLGVFDLTRR